MKKSQVNFIIDAAMFIVMMAIVGLGFLMKYVLLTGQEKWLKFGRNIDMWFLGMDRHQWGKVHLILGFILLGLLTLHIILHWAQIKCLFARLVIKRNGRMFITAMFTIFSLLLVVVPFLVKPEVTELDSGDGHFSDRYSVPETASPGTEASPSREHQPAGRKYRNEPAGTLKQATEPREGPRRNEGTGGQHEEGQAYQDLQLRGYMTLKEVADLYKISSEDLIRALDLPLTTPDEERLGHLRRSYGFTMSEVKRVIQDRQTAD